MVLSAGTAIEHDAVVSRPHTGITFTFGFSSRCPLKTRCGNRCALIKTLPQTADMPPQQRDAAIDELIDAGPAIRHAVACEWEPFAESDALKRALMRYHAAPVGSRPQAFGAITSGLHFRRAPWLPEYPFTWILVSIDGEADTHRRGFDLWQPAWQGLLDVRDSGGAGFVGANCVLDNGTLESTISLAKRLVDAGIPYMGTGPYLSVVDGRLRSMVSEDDLVRSFDRLTQELSRILADTDFTVMFELPEGAFTRITGINPHAVSAQDWRLEKRFAGSPVVAATINPRPGRWLRLRVDGQIIDKTQLMTVGVTQGVYGRYAPGRLTEIIASADAAANANTIWNDQPYIKEAVA